jgi:hypothetical protein
MGPRLDPRQRPLPVLVGEPFPGSIALSDVRNDVAALRHPSRWKVVGS